jgi:hypothetical protein
LFDEPVPTFGRFQVTAALGDGRFGPVHLGIDPQTDQVVVIRTFVERLTAEQQQALLDALEQLCEQPLDHESIATPIASGLEHGVPYLAHSYLPGTSVDEFLRTHGPRPLTEVAVRVTHLAAAIDFAAAADVHHGALSPRDIIFAPQSTGVSGFGLVQALRAAGIGLNAPTQADDIYALAAMTFELLVGYRFAGGSVREALVPLRGASGVDYERLVAALEPTLSGDPAEWPTTALALAESLHQSQSSTQQVAPTPRPSGREVGRLSFGADDVESLGMGPATEPLVAASTTSDAGALSMFPAEGGEHVPATSHPVAPSGPVWDESPAAPAAFDVPLHVDPALRDPGMYESVADAGAPDHLVADEAAHHAEGMSLHDAMSPAGDGFSDEPSHVGGASVREESRRPVRPHEPVIYRPPTPAAPAFNTVNSSSGSGWRLVAAGAGVAALILIAVAIWVFRRQAATPSTSQTETSISQPAERVDQPPPLTSGDASAAPGSVAPAPADAASASAANLSTSAASPSPAAPTGSATASPSAAAPAPEPPPVVDEPSGSRRSARGRENAAASQPADVTPPAPRSSAGTASSGSASRRAAAAERSASAARPRAERAAAAAAPGAATRASSPDSAAVPSGRVLVRSTPAGATVLVDGTPHGQTPAAIRDLPFGSHVIMVTSVGYSPWQQTITLTPDRPSQSFEVSLDGSGGTSSGVPAVSGLQIDSRPSGAQVFVDGTAVGVTPVVLPTVSTGTHAIRIEMTGYRPWSTSVAVNGGQRTRVSASLEQ